MDTGSKNVSVLESAKFGQNAGHAIHEESKDSIFGQETDEDEETHRSSGLEWLDELLEESDDDDDDDGDLPLEPDSDKKISFADTAWIFKLRRHLDQLDSFHRQKENEVLKSRKKLKQCRQNIESWLELKEKIEKEMEEQLSKHNSLAHFELDAEHKQLCQKLQSKKELKEHIHTELRQQEVELSKVKVEIGRVSLLWQEVQKKDQAFQVLKAQKAKTRLQKEWDVSRNLQYKMERLKNEQAIMLKKQEVECQKKMEEGRANRRIAAKFLKQTISRMQQQKAEKEQQNSEHIQKRLQAVQSLKSNIAASQGSLQAQQRRAREHVQTKEQQQKELKESLKAHGINSIKSMFQQKQLEETKRKQREFEESQKSKKMEIAANIAMENQLMKLKKKKQLQSLKHPCSDKTPSLKKQKENPLPDLDPIPLSVPEEKATAHVGALKDISSPSVTSDAEELEEIQETNQPDLSRPVLSASPSEPELSEPCGEDHKKPESITEMQTEIKKEQTPVTRKLLPHTPVKKVDGKEHECSVFSSKPEVVHFKDFDVGKIYRKKILLTNTSYTSNQCKFLRLSDSIKDVITVSFQRSGPLSAGMSCDLQVTFQPAINEDFEGNIHFASTLGPFSIPVRCMIKKFIPEVLSQFVNFGSHVVGQTISQTITLTNKGALAAHFSLDTPTSPSPEPTQLPMSTHSSANTRQEDSSEKTSSTKKSSVSVSADEVRSNQLPGTPDQAEPDASLEAVPEASFSAAEDTQNDLSFSDYNDIRLGDIREGEIGPFQRIALEVLFSPSVPGESKLDLLILFSDPNTKPIPIEVRGVAVSMPVWVVLPSIDLKICRYDGLYQDSIILQSRASTALKLTFEVCPEMRKHMEILPKTGIIRAQSTFNAQLKFMPRKSLSKDAEKFFDSETSVLEVPLTVKVSSQVQSAHFTLHAIVTSSELQFDRTEVDFGLCSIDQSVRRRVQLTNMSLLPQDFGFVGTPEYIKVEPNDGFGTLLTQEIMTIDLIFSPKKAKDYCFQLTCKSGINRDFLLSCQAVGVSPPLRLSHSGIQFRPTAVGDKSAAELHLTNHHSDGNEAKQAGAESMTVAVPRLFCFSPPEDSAIGISPSSGRLLPGESCTIQVMFRPVLSDKDIEEEALYREKLRQEEVPTDTEDPSLETVTEKASEHVLTDSDEPVDIQIRSDQYYEAKDSLLRSFTQLSREHMIPCFVMDEQTSETETHVQPEWSPKNTLFLVVKCTAVRPPLVAVTNNGNNVIDFGQVSVGERAIERFVVENISNEDLNLSSSVLDVLGPFSLLNPLRCKRPGEKQNLVLAFSPSEEKKYCEILKVQCRKMGLELILHGEGVVSADICSNGEGPMDHGHVVEKDSVSKQPQNITGGAASSNAVLDSKSQDGAKRSSRNKRSAFTAK